MKLACLVLLLLVGCRAQPRNTAAEARFDLPGNVARIVLDDDEFADFAEDVRPQLEAIADHDAIFVVAMLDALDGRWQRAVARLDNIAVHDRDEDRAYLRGLTIRAWADTGKGRFRPNFARQVDRVPRRLWPQLSELRAMANVFTRAFCRRVVEEQTGTRRVGTLRDVHVIVFQRYVVVHVLPVARQIEEVLAERDIDLPEGVPPRDWGEEDEREDY